MTAFVDILLFTCISFKYKLNTLKIRSSSFKCRDNTTGTVHMYTRPAVVYLCTYYYNIIIFMIRVITRTVLRFKSTVVRFSSVYIFVLMYKHCTQHPDHINHNIFYEYVGSIDFCKWYNNIILQIFALGKNG